MKFLMQNIHLFIVVLCILCQMSMQAQTWQQIMDQIDAKITQKKLVSSKRSSILGQISTTQNQIKMLSADLISAKFAAQNAYRSYFDAKVQCDGFSTDSKMIGIRSQLSDEVCLQSPISTQAYNLFTLKTQLEGYQINSQNVNKSNQIQNELLKDMENELNIYRNLSAFVKNKTNSNLLIKFTNQAYEFNNLYTLEKMAVDAYKPLLDSAKSTQNYSSQAVLYSQGLINPQKTRCQQNLITLRGVLNQKLKQAVKIKVQINESQDKIRKGFADSDLMFLQLNRLTDQMKKLIDKWALLTASLVASGQ